ncbi:hypothetical protein BKA80DRAFT_26599 [Phyllosticta citrichinensis]
MSCFSLCFSWAMSSWISSVFFFVRVFCFMPRFWLSIQWNQAGAERVVVHRTRANGTVRECERGRGRRPRKMGRQHGGASSPPLILFGLSTSEIIIIIFIIHCVSLMKFLFFFFFCQTTTFPLFFLCTRNQFRKAGRWND